MLSFMITPVGQILWYQIWNFGAIYFHVTHYLANQAKSHGLYIYLSFYCTYTLKGPIQTNGKLYITKMMMMMVVMKLMDVWPKHLPLWANRAWVSLANKFVKYLFNWFCHTSCHLSVSQEPKLIKHRELNDLYIIINCVYFEMNRIIWAHNSNSSLRAWV